jgi:hypothetical protein
MEAPQIARSQFTNVAGLSFYSTFQAASLFTLSAIFKDGNKTKCHSWRQEIRTKLLQVDQEHAHKRFIHLATTCTCKINSRNCFYCNHQSILIYCNVTDQLVFKIAHKTVKMISDLSFGIGKEGSVFLTKINSDSVTKLSVAHAKENIKFNQLNK